MSLEKIPLVYIVDDEESFNALLVLVLGKYGMKCESFRTSTALLARVKIRSPDLCIIDLNLGPLEKGYDLISTLRRIGDPNMPIIICSGEDQREIIAHALEMGANDYLIKPVDRSVLTAKLLQFIKTTELDFSQTGSTSILPLAALDTTIEIGLKLCLIEEDGVTLVSQHLILKGTLVSLAGAIIEEISGRQAALSVSVVSSELSPENDNYLVYLEFDTTDKELLQNVRGWLSKRWTPSDKFGDFPEGSEVPTKINPAA